MDKTSCEIRLEVLIATLGTCALERLSLPSHLEFCEGVRYLISCQEEGEYDCRIPSCLSSREDVRIHVFKGKGVSANRNNLLELSSAPFLLIADDDIIYRKDALRGIMERLEKDHDVDIAVFKSINQDQRRYPQKEVYLNYGRFKRNHYPAAIEIGLRRSSIERIGLRFDERFGINAPFLCAGEEDVLLFDGWEKGLRIKYYPFVICEHLTESTFGKMRCNDRFIITSGAGLHHLYGKWTLIRILYRMLTKKPRTIRTLCLLLQGARYDKHTTG